MTAGLVTIIGILLYVLAVRLVPAPAARPYLPHCRVCGREVLLTLDDLQEGTNTFRCCETWQHL